MLPKKDSAAAQRATEWAQKLTLRLIFLTSQTEVVGIVYKQSKIIEEILQSHIEFGFLRAWTTTFESLSRMYMLKERELATEQARRATCASPTLGEQGGPIWEDKWRTYPSESWHTIAWAENKSLMAVSKLILTQLRGGGDHFSTVTVAEERQANKCSREILLIWADTKWALNETLSWRALFL